MESVNNIEQAIEIFELNSNNYYYTGQQFENYSQIEDSAKDHFEDCGYNTEFMKVDKVGTSKFFNNETNCVISIDRYESHAGDSAVGPEDYFYGYIVTEN